MPIILPKCPENYEINKENCRCKKIKPKTVKKVKKKTQKRAVKKTVKKAVEKTVKKAVKKTVKKKTVKKPAKKSTVKCSREKIKLCNDINKRCNPLTGRCNKITEKKALPRVPRKIMTPEQKNNILKERLSIVSKKHSYSPSINKKLMKMRSVSPHKDLFDRSCKPYQIFVNNKCYSWKSKKAEKFLLDNLLSKKPVVGKNIIGPNQSWNNCWFNVFFTMFFISDKARKFLRNFRQAMITGKIRLKNSTNIVTIPSRVHKPMWLLNKFITASLLGKQDPLMYASLIDTNNVVQGLYNALPKKFKYVKQGNAANPLSMYINLLNYIDSLSPGNFPVTNYRIIHDIDSFSQLTKKNSRQYDYIERSRPHMIIIELADLYDDGNVPSPPVKKFKKKLKYKFGDMEYKLDSIGIRDNGHHHICSLLTINGKDYMFDGENFSPLFQKNWRHLLNKNQNFKITQSIPETYNLTRGYQVLMYYRTK